MCCVVLRCVPLCCVFVLCCLISLVTCWKKEYPFNKRRRGWLGPMKVNFKLKSSHLTLLWKKPEFGESFLNRLTNKGGGGGSHDKSHTKIEITQRLTVTFFFNYLTVTCWKKECDLFNKRRGGWVGPMKVNFKLLWKKLNLEKVFEPFNKQRSHDKKSTFKVKSTFFFSFSIWQ